MENFAILFIAIHSVSIAFGALVLRQFHNTHKRRINMLMLFDYEGELDKRIDSEILQRRIVIAVYLCTTLIITIVTTFLFVLQPLWLT